MQTPPIEAICRPLGQGLVGTHSPNPLPQVLRGLRFLPGRARREESKRDSGSGHHKTGSEMRLLHKPSLPTASLEMAKVQWKAAAWINWGGGLEDSPCHSQI